MGRRFVVTGAPCSGKTTLINELGRRGFYIVRESARRVLDLNPHMRHSSATIGDRDLLQRNILALQLEEERKIPPDRTAFLDSGIHSGIAYCEAVGLEPHESLLAACEKNRYDGVFVLDRLPVYENDSVRQQSSEEAQKLHELLYVVYARFGHKPMRVPVMPVKERADFVESCVGL